MATIADVARAAGVSRSTVSYAMSGNRSISQATRDRVQAAIDSLGFTPHAGARALKTSQTMVIALFLQFNEDEFAPATFDYVLPITSAARQQGYDTLMVTEADGAAAVRRLTASGMIDGAVLLDVVESDARLAPLRAAQLPSATVGTPADPSGFDVFDLDFAAAARVLVGHLADQGHREVLLITPPQHVFDRGGAYAWRFRDAALAEADRRGVQLHAHYGESQQPAVTASTDAALDRWPGITALLVHNDGTAAALPGLLARRGLVVPRDLSVASLYSSNFARTFSLPYTTVETSPDELGRLAVQHLLLRITDPERAGAHLLRYVPPRITDRGSTA